MFTRRALLALVSAGMLCGCAAAPDAGLQALAQAPAQHTPNNYRQLIAHELGNANSKRSRLIVAEEFSGPNNKRRAGWQTGASIQDQARNFTLTGAQVSDLRTTSGPQLGEWMACVKVKVDKRPSYLAVFFENGEVLDYRTAVAIDHCSAVAYGPLVAEAPQPKKRK